MPAVDKNREKKKLFQIRDFMAICTLNDSEHKNHNKWNVINIPYSKLTHQIAILRLKKKWI